MLGIIVDSTAYLTKKEAHLYGIQVLPARYFIDGILHREQYIDSLSDDDEKNYSLSSNLATRHTPTFVFANLFHQLLLMDYDILCLTISSKMSSAFETAKRAAAMQKQPNKIRVIDSKLTVGGLYILAKTARIYDREGFSLHQIASAMEEEKRRIRIRFTVDDLSFLEKSKRIRNIRLSAAPVLNNAPIFICRDGAICLERTVRRGHDRIKAMISDIPEQSRYIMINYIDKTEDFYALRKQIKNKFPNAYIEERKIGPVVGINIGRTVLAVIWEDVDWLPGVSNI